MLRRATLKNLDIEKEQYVFFFLLNKENRTYTNAIGDRNILLLSNLHLCLQYSVVYFMYDISE